jgi:MFS family permease
VAPVTALQRYGEVLRGGLAVPLVASVVGRLSYGMTTLALVLMVRDDTGSYATAGLVTAAYALSFGVLGPARARAADRTGPRRALLLTATVQPPLLVAVVLLSSAGAPAWALLPPTVLAGAMVPPLGPVMRALWAARLTGPQLSTAYAVEAVAVELCFVIGPLLAALLAATVDPAAAVVASAVLAMTGALWLAATRSVRAVVPHEVEAVDRAGPLRSAAVRALLLTVVGIGAGFGAIEVGMPAFAEETGSRPAAAGLLLAVWSVGSIAGGLVYGALHLTAAPARQLPVLVAMLAAGSLLPAVVAVLGGGPLLMGAALLLYGTTIAPFSACNSVLLGAAAPPGTVTEAFAWSSSAIFGGAALGTLLAGFLVEGPGVGAGLAVTGGAGLLALAASLAGLARLPERAVSAT